MSYREFVHGQKHNNPCLAGLSNFLCDPDSERRSCRILRLDFSADTEGAEFQHVELEHLQETIYPTGEEGRRRILIIEDLRRDVIEILGSAYRIDPIFFASHLHAPFRQMDNQTPNLACLPSRQRKQNFVNFHYHRTVELKGDVENEDRLTRDMNVDRKIAVLLPTERTRIALVQHACSVILFKDGEGGQGWLSIILVDSPVMREYLPVLYANEMKSGHQVTRRASRVDSGLFLNGYEDFLPPSNVPLHTKGAFWSPQLSRDSLLDGLRYYWERELPDQFDPLRPTLFALSVYPLKIIAAEWNNYMAAMSYHIKRHEYAVEAFNQAVTELDKLNVELRSLQAWRRRSLASQHKIASVKNFVTLHTPQAANSSYNPALEEAAGLQEDYAYLAGTLDDLSRRLRNMLPFVTSLVQISDSRRSLAESANVNRLTSLAIVFAPLSFTTGLFSMDTTNGPGGTHFWVFFAVAIPITIVVFLLARPPVWVVHWVSTRGRASERAFQLQV
ncbi:hypothetical protein BDW59DRAFT_177454 [Aspergillus cavernicola]|uniref:Uncharacterized protein n=1 Tax=Aspergillus cavernicola TaxID=176166 RepID=A0ABR4HKZ2_9EURO